MGAIRTARTTVTSLEWMNRDTLLLGIGGAGVAGQTFPGQFFMLKCWEDLSPLWSRPFSICDLNGEELIFMVRAFGRGSRRIASRKPGEEICMLGPLGQAMPADESASSYVLVAGGIGVAPFPLVVKRLRSLNPACGIILIYGERTASTVVDLSSLLPGIPVIVTTDDGTRGRSGTAVGALAEQLEETPGATVVACGPKPMLKAIQDHPAASGARLVFFMEEFMACGFGTCMGCVTRVIDGTLTSYVRICREGPVMDGRRIVF
jgi:dihydroorotate dehydrogenase electron transfer subunit